MLQGDIPELTKEDCSAQRALVREVLREDLNLLFAIDHGHLGQNNIIVNREWHIVG